LSINFQSLSASFQAFFVFLIIPVAILCIYLIFLF
jgi:hypothetical protein